MDTLPKRPAEDICVARQPIFNARLDVVAYELLYRDMASAARAIFSDGAIATSRVVVAAVAEIGLEKLCGPSVIHLNLPRELIVNPVALPLSPKSTVLEVLETVQSDAAVLAGLRVLREEGFRIALDDYVSAHHDERLLQLADIVKVDVLREPADRLADTAATLQRRGVELIAEKVETREQFERCSALGFHGFQGFFFERPETFFGRRAPSHRLTTLRVLSALQNPDATPEALAELASQDLALVHRLLRFLNSGYYNLPQKVGSVRHAIVMLGLENLRRLCAIVALAAFDDRPGYLLLNAMVRARMCELLGATASGHGSGEFFFAGLLSHLDALLGVSTDEAVQSLPLSAALSSALTAHSGPIGEVLQSVSDFEQGHWGGSQAAGLDAARLQAAYVEAVRWAEDALAHFLPRESVAIRDKRTTAERGTGEDTMTKTSSFQKFCDCPVVHRRVSITGVTVTLVGPTGPVVSEPTRITCSDSPRCGFLVGAIGCPQSEMQITER
jgi:EAL and modified HD-GYP domain-containing signal transduction protein